MTLEELRRKLAERQGALKAALEKPSDQRTDADRSAIKSIPGELTALKGEIDDLEGAEKALKAATDYLAPRRPTFASQPPPKPGAKGTDGASEHSPDGSGLKAGIDDDLLEVGESEIDKKYPTGGFKNFRHFLTVTLRAKDGKGSHDAVKACADWRDLCHRRDSALKAGGMTTVDEPIADLLVPMQFSQEFFKRIVDRSDILSRVRRMPISGNSIRIPGWKDDDQSDLNQRFGGVIAYWVNEGDPITGSKINKVRWMDFRLKKVGALVILSEELQEDALALGSLIEENAIGAIEDKITEAVWQGNGVSGPLGVFTPALHPSVISIAKENAQAADTVVTQNIVKMFHQMHKRGKATATWHAHTTVFPQLDVMTLGAAGSNLAVYMPPGGMSAAPYGTLRGRPVIEEEFSEVVGDQNDLTFCDWSYYQFVFKGQTKRDLSTHVRFVTDENVLKFTFRCDGQPLVDKPMTLRKGGTKVSPFVTLDARA